ncbi:MAG TPA: lamin tail domain-containing protein, partial [Verrucomicrobiae bacterium]|nr:lamin tail domain-containing protein [Verrucomicrobiae bacterium]
MMFRTIRWLGCLTFLAAFSAFSQDIIINEIMYKPLVAGAGTAEEWIELHNRGTTNVNLNGWSLTEGVDFRFTNNITIFAGGYYVIAANFQSFKALYPSVNNVVGGWSGSLKNSGEDIELTSPAGVVVDRVRYASEGDWGTRRRGPLLSGTRGWEWVAEHDGLGKSVELINPSLPNDSGQNWAASATTGGTPGARNSLYNTNIAPLILEVGHSPLVPTSGDAVTINARFIDEGSNITAAVWWRTLANPFTSLDMFDDGEHNDGSAGDGLYGAVLPPQGDRTVVEFYVKTTDGSGNSRTWPAAALDEFGQAIQSANALYQVDDTVYTGPDPIYRVILTAAELQTYLNINRQSDAQMNATFITIDPVETLVRYNCGYRIRGAGSRSRTPPNNRVNIPNDRKWKGVDSINLNCQYPHSGLIGSVVAKRAGLPVADSRLIQVRLNGVNRANSGLPNLGSYIAVEIMDSTWAEKEFPFDSEGNIYRMSDGSHRADLNYVGNDPATYIGRGYNKQSNNAENDWSDLINLCLALSNTPPAQYTATITNLVNVREWMRYFAIIDLMEYSETCLGTGEGDDYSTYRGVYDQRFQLLGHDFDTIFNEGDTRGNITENIFQAADFTDQASVANFFTWPDFVPIFYDELYRLATTTFSPEQLFPIFDRYLNGWVPPDRIDSMKTFAANRRAYILSQIPLNVSVTPTLPLANGYYQAPGSTVSLSGRANAIRTRSVRVNGIPASWDARNAAWSVSGLPLNPGVNRVVISSFDENGVEFDTGAADVWYDIGSLNSVSGAISVNTAWIPAASPYFVSGTLQVDNGATLTIAPGTSVYLAPNANIEVTASGRLIAEGTPTNRIRLTRRPGTTGNWGEIFFNGSGASNRLVNVDVEFGGASGRSLHANNAVVYFDGLNFANAAGNYCSLDNSAFEIRNSGFPNTTGAELIHGIGLRAGGYGIIESNYFGSTTGLNDIIDFTGGQRPGPILQVLNNIFSGASDDVLDLDGTDAHIEGNIFMNVHQATPGGDTSSAVSGGADSGNTSDLTIVRNFFYDCDHAILAKEGNFYTIVNNTMVNIAQAAVNFDEPARRNQGVTPGRGAYLDGNIIWNCATNFENRYVNDPTFGTTELTVTRCILSGGDLIPGNLAVDPKLVNTNVTLATIRQGLA